MTHEERYDTFRRGQLFFELGHPADAVRILDDLVAREPDNTAVVELYARALFASAQLGRAEQALRRLVALRPDDGWARFALARTLERQSRHDEAREHKLVAAALGTAA